MFNNWIDIAEPFSLLRRMKRETTLRRKILARIHLSGKARIVSSWAHTESPPTHWWDIPAVEMRCNRMVSGDEHVRHEKYVAEKYAAGRDGLHALSLGCGTGGREIRWAKTGIFKSIDAYDLSEQRIHAAVRSVADTPEAAIIRYRAADIFTLDLPRMSYDLVLFEHSLHHFSPLETLLLRMKDVLKPGGILVANEFIGPSRFQWTDRQLAAVNALLRVFPAEHTTLFESRFPKRGAVRPSKLAMWLSDPSEARESSDILPLLRKHFELNEVKGYGGTILHLLFAGIAHHFITPDAKAEKLLRFSFDMEDLLLDLHEIEHDFAVIVCTNNRVNP